MIDHKKSRVHDINLIYNLWFVTTGKDHEYTLHYHKSQTADITLSENYWKITRHVLLYQENLSACQPFWNYRTHYTALLWQKEASDESDFSCKRAKCVFQLHWHQCNIMTSRLQYLSAGWVILLKIGIELEHAKYDLKTSITQIWMSCHLLPFAKVGQYTLYT